MLAYLSARHKPGWMAVLLQEGRVTLAHGVCRRGARPAVLLLETFAVEGDEAATLQRLRASRRLGDFACTTLMPDGAYTLSLVDAPAVPPEERREALRWSLKELVDYPVDTACLGVLELPGEGLLPGRSAGVLVVSAAEQAVRTCAAPFEAAKIALAAIDVPELAQRNVAALLEDDNRGLVLLRIDEGAMMMTLTFRGELITVRRGEMNTHQLAGSDAEQAARVQERLVLELQRSLDNFDRQYSHIPISKVVLACYPPVSGLAEVLGQSTYVPVHPMDLSTVLDFASVPALKEPAFQARHLLAIGAALRNEEEDA